jgi:hypothetical protein
MGFNPLDPNVAKRCPNGWISKYMFDMSSGNGAAKGSGLAQQPQNSFWAWCEYQDPHALCNSLCAQNAVNQGIAIDLDSTVDSTGFAWCHGNCSCPGGVRSPAFDMGRGSGEGLGWCGNINYVWSEGAGVCDPVQECVNAKISCGTQVQLAGCDAYCRHDCPTLHPGAH